MQNFFFHINGVGNAWPVSLGEEHPFYDKNKEGHLANSSFSVLGKEDKEIKSELLIDAGHGVIQYLIKKRNRIPEAIVITHPHLDHTLSLDWIGQSFFKKWKKQKRYPVYCTDYCFEIIIQSFPHLKNILEHKALYPGELRQVDEIPEIAITSFPVYHGKASFGSTAILITIHEEDKLLLTGDILSPLFRKEDYRKLNNIPYLVADANNRFPYPKSNHWSIVTSSEEIEAREERLTDFRKEMRISEMIETQKPYKTNRKYLLRVQQEFKPNEAILSLEDFALKLNPANIILCHYSGDEDYRHYQEERLNVNELLNWVSEIAVKRLNAVQFHVPLQQMEFPLE